MVHYSVPSQDGMCTCAHVYTSRGCGLWDVSPTNCPHGGVSHLVKGCREDNDTMICRVITMDI